MICLVKPTKLLNLKQGSKQKTRGIYKGWQWELMSTSFAFLYNDVDIYKRFHFQLQYGNGRVVFDSFWSINHDQNMESMISTLVWNAEHC